MFTPFRLKGMTLPNRVAVSPLCMYSATDGTVNDFHLVHRHAARELGYDGFQWPKQDRNVLRMQAY